MNISISVFHQIKLAIFLFLYTFLPLTFVLVIFVFEFSIARTFIGMILTNILASILPFVFTRSMIVSILKFSLIFISQVFEYTFSFIFACFKDSLVCFSRSKSDQALPFKLVIGKKPRITETICFESALHPMTKLISTFKQIAIYFFLPLSMGSPSFEFPPIIIHHILHQDTFSLRQITFKIAQIGSFLRKILSIPSLLLILNHPSKQSSITQFNLFHVLNILHVYFAKRLQQILYLDRELNTIWLSSCLWLNITNTTILTSHSLFQNYLFTLAITSFVISSYKNIFIREIDGN